MAKEALRARCLAKWQKDDLTSIKPESLTPLANYWISDLKHAESYKASEKYSVEGLREYFGSAT
jgi:hypothetical protein